MPTERIGRRTKDGPREYLTVSCIEQAVESASSSSIRNDPIQHAYILRDHEIARYSCSFPLFLYDILYICSRPGYMSATSTLFVVGHYISTSKVPPYTLLSFYS